MSLPAETAVNMTWYVNTTTQGKHSVRYLLECNDTHNISEGSVSSYVYVDILTLGEPYYYNATYIPFIDNFTQISVNVIRVSSASDANVSVISVSYNGTTGVACDPPVLNGSTSVCTASNTYDFAHFATATDLNASFDNLTIEVTDAEGDYDNITFNGLMVYPNPYFGFNDTSATGDVNMSGSWLMKYRMGTLRAYVAKVGGFNSSITINATSNSSYIDIVQCTIDALNSTEDYCDMQIILNEIGETALNITAYGPAMNATYNYDITAYDWATISIYNMTNQSEPVLERMIELGAHSTGAVEYHLWINNTDPLYTAALKNVTFDYTEFTNNSDSFEVVSSAYGGVIENGTFENASVTMVVPTDAVAGRYSGIVTVGAFNSNQTQNVTLWINITPSVRCSVNASSVSANFTKNTGYYTYFVYVNNTGNVNITAIEITENTDWGTDYVDLDQSASTTSTNIKPGNVTRAGFDIAAYSTASAGTTYDRTAKVTCYSGTYTGTDTFGVSISTNSESSDDDDDSNNGDGSNTGGWDNVGGTSATLSISLIELDDYPKNPDVYAGSSAKFKVKVCNGGSVTMGKVEVSAEPADDDDDWKVTKATFKNLASTACNNDIVKIKVPSSADLGEHNFTLKAQRIGNSLTNKPTYKVSINVLKKPVVKKSEEKKESEDDKEEEDESETTSLAVVNDTMTITISETKKGNVTVLIVIKDSDGKIMYNYTETVYLETKTNKLTIKLPSSNLNGTYSIYVKVLDEAGSVVGEKTTTLAITPFVMHEDVEKTRWLVYGFYMTIIGVIAGFIGLWVYTGEMPAKKVIEKGGQKIPQIKKLKLSKPAKFGGRKDQRYFTGKKDQEYFYGKPTKAQTVEVSAGPSTAETALVQKIEKLEVQAREAYQKGQHAKGRQLANQVKELMAKLETTRTGNSG